MGEGTVCETPFPLLMGKSSAETTLIILMANAGFLLDSGPGHSHCGVGGKSRIKPGHSVVKFPQAGKSLLVGRTKQTRIMFVLDLLSLSL